MSVSRAEASIPYRIFEGRCQPLADVVSRTPVRVERVVRLRVPHDFYIHVAPPERSARFNKAIRSDSVQDIGVHTGEGQLQRVIIGTEASLREFLPSIFRATGRERRAMNIDLERVIRFYMSHERFLVETLGTRDEYSDASDNGIIDDMTTSYAGRQRLIVGPENEVLRLFPQTHFSIEPV